MSRRSRVRRPGAWGRPWGQSRRAPARGRRLQRPGGRGTVERRSRKAPCARAARPATATHPHAAPAQVQSARNSPGQMPDKPVPPSDAAHDVAWPSARLHAVPQSSWVACDTLTRLCNHSSTSHEHMRQQLDACGQAHRARLGAAPAAQALRAPPPPPSAARSARPQPGPRARAASAHAL